MEPETPPPPLVLLLGNVSRQAEQLFLSRFAAAGFPELRRRHAALFQALAESGMRAKELSSRLGITPQAVAQLIDDLERSGDVIRTPDPSDGRARLVSLTPRGRTALGVCDEILAALEAELGEAIGTAALTQLEDALTGVGRHFGDKG